MVENKISIKPFQKALTSLDKVLAMPEDDVVRDACIQRFEFTLELAYKTAKKLLGISERAPKQIIRALLQDELIKDAQIWFDAINYRNLSSHTYNESLAVEMLQFIRIFLSELKELEAKLLNIINESNT